MISNLPTTIMKKFNYVLLYLLSANILVFGQDSDIQKYGNLIAPAELKDNLSILASDALEGRETGKRGQKMAATFIASYFEEIGLKGPVDGSYFQPIEFNSLTITQYSVRSGNNYFNTVNELVYIGLEPTEGEVKADLVFAGYGNKEDFDLVDVKDKCVLLITKDTIEGSWWPAFVLGYERGAKEILYIPENVDEDCEKLMQLIETIKKGGFIKLKNSAVQSVPHFFAIKPSYASKLMNTTTENLILVAKDFAKKYKKIKPIKISYSVDIEEKPAYSADNILGFLEGTDKKDEVVILTAHYDHVGIMDGEEDVIYNGADDDGSGTVAIMNIAKAFMQAKRVLFMAVTAEEKGLLGSEHYVQNPVFPLDKTIVDLNLDMVGRRDSIHFESAPYVYIIGSDKLSMDLHTLSEATNKSYTNLILDYTYNDVDHPENLYQRSDQWSFAKKNIPSICYFSGLHDDYHQPSDEVDRIEFGLLAKRAQLAFYTAWEIANREITIVPDLKTEKEEIK